MAGNWQLVMNSRWAVLPSMASMSGFAFSQRPTCSGRPTVGCPAGSDTRSREGRSSTASLHLPSGVQNSVGVGTLRVVRASSLAQASATTTTWPEGSTAWSRSS